MQVKVCSILCYSILIAGQVQAMQASGSPKLRSQLHANAGDIMGGVRGGAHETAASISSLDSSTTSSGTEDASVPRLMQWNILADGLASDGFVASSGEAPWMSEYAKLQTEFKQKWKNLEEEMITKGLASKQGSPKHMKLKDLGKGLAKCEGMDDPKLTKETVESWKDVDIMELCSDKKITAYLTGRPEQKPAMLGILMEYGMMKVASKTFKEGEEEWRNPPSDEKNGGVQASTALDELVNWEVRKNKIITKIMDSDVDFVVLEEMDHYQDMLSDLGTKYTSQCGGGDASASYAPLSEFVVDGDKPARKKPKAPDAKIAAAEAYTRYLGEQKTFAFAPKLFSNARMYHPKSGCALKKTCDDDGTAVFWKKDKYTCSEVVAFPIDDKLADGSAWQDSDGVPNTSQGGVCVKLERTETNQQFVVCGSHLASGKAQQDRVNHATNLRKQINSLFSAGEDANVKLILAMDANIQIPTSEEDADMTEKCRTEVPEGQQVFDVLTKGDENGKMDDLKLYSNPSQEKGGRKVAAVSVNKMRGADSAQPQKVGEYELHNIDWVACTGAAPVVDADQLQYFSKENEHSFQSILPNSISPSDHLPVFVSFPAQ